eukprot:scaffold6992_cov151-Skeletonema_menzelii.AAC.5
MPPSIDGNESPGPSRGQGAGAGCDGSTTAAIAAERMAENSSKGMKLNSSTAHERMAASQAVVGILAGFKA